MVSLRPPLSREVARVYTERGDVGFAELLSLVPAMGDAELGELIDADGRARIARGLAVELERYLGAIDGLASRVDALDAAIDMTLRSMVALGDSQGRAAETLIANYPALSHAVREASTLSLAVMSTVGLRRTVAPEPTRALPCDFGPRQLSGEARYRLTQLLGRGTGGEVYRAVDRLLSEDGHEALVAIKVLAPREYTGWTHHRITEEATKARRVLHPNVVRVMDRGVGEQGEDFIVYEFVDGGDLESWVRTHPGLAVEKAVELVVRMARGVQAAHSAGLVHCDIKPGNILMSAGGDPKVADFGVAVRQDPWESDASRPGRPVGNLAFISPEQYRMEPGCLTPASDLYALGGVFYWLITSRLPNGSSLEEIDRVHDPVDGRAVAPTITGARRGVDGDLDAILERCLAPRPQNRYGSAGQLADDLDRWLRREPIGWRRPTVSRRLALFARRKPGLAVALALLFALMAGGGPWLWHLNEVATQKRIEAGIVSGKLAGREKERKEAVQAGTLMYQAIKLAKGGRETWEVLPIIPYVEWAFGTDVVGSPGDRSLPWEDRVFMIRGLRDHALRVAGEDDLETVFLDTTLAYWLLTDRRVDEASQILDGTYRRWARAFPDQTRWLGWVDAMRACAVVQRQADRPAGAPMDAAALAEAEATLVRVLPTMTAGPTQTPLRRLVDRTMGELYGPGLLDDPVKAKPFIVIPDKK